MNISHIYPHTIESKAWKMLKAYWCCARSGLVAFHWHCIILWVHFSACVSVHDNPAVLTATDVVEAHQLNMDVTDPVGSSFPLPICLDVQVVQAVLVKLKNIGSQVCLSASDFVRCYTWFQAHITLNTTQRIALVIFSTISVIHVYRQALVTLSI